MSKAGDSIGKKLREYVDPSAAKEWFSSNYDRIRELLEDGWVRDFVFEPIKDVFVLEGVTPGHEIRAAITRVAVVNAVLAGLPGKMGVGIFVSMSLEAWMALVIAERIGVSIKDPVDIFKYFSLLAGIGVTIIWLFRALLGLLFSLFSWIPGLNPLIPAELVATNLIGVLFWIGFEQAAKGGSFKVPMRAYIRIRKETKSLYLFQWNILKTAFSPSNLRLMGERVAAWFRGEIPQNKEVLRGELFATAAMATLIARDFDQLEGPLAGEFIGAIKDRYPDLADASLAEIADHMSQYDPEQMSGVISLIKGKLFERMVVLHENADGDEWTAYMHEDESYPGSDIVMTNEDTGEQIDVSLKASMDPEYIEAALLRYPDIPMMFPEELTDILPEHSGYIPTNISHEEVLTVTEENFESLLTQLVPVDAVDVSAGGIAAGAAIGLWPFVVAFMKENISYEQLSSAFERVYGVAGKALASRVSYSLVLGPVFAWYLLARGVIVVTRAGESLQVRRLLYSPRAIANFGSDPDVAVVAT